MLQSVPLPTLAHPGTPPVAPDADEDLSCEPHLGQPHFMVVPSLACPAQCSYCFGPHHGATTSPEIMEATLDFMERIAGKAGQRKVKVTFHGGEPLRAGHALWRQALEGLRKRFGHRGYQVSLQSNLWLLDVEFCHLFREHQVDIGTSLDGPETITDQQRGPGYFGRTMRGVGLARSYGMSVGCIATFTPASAHRWREVFDYFLSERLGLSIHPAVPPLQVPDSPHAIGPEQYGQLLREMLDYYVQRRQEIAVSSLDQVCRAVGSGEGKVCTFRDCLGMFLAIDPHGDIYPCQRFCGFPEFRLGKLGQQPVLATLFDSPMGRRMAARQQAVRDACHDCPHRNYCQGGCPYNAWASGQPDRVRDPYCPAYRTLFEHIHRRLVTEMGSEANLNAVAERPYTGRGHPLLRQGPLIDLVREGPHPSEIARTAKRIIAAVELARGPDFDTVAARLVEQGLCRTPQSAAVSLAGLQSRLQAEVPAPSALDQRRLNNLYLHVTFACQLECSHCYALAGHEASRPPSSEMSVADFERLVREAKAHGFRQVIITGGEPLTHSRRSGLLQMLTEARRWAAPMNLILRTNLAMPLDATTLRQIGDAVDQVVVSVDGNEQTHDARRGSGTYAAVVRNLEAYVALGSAAGAGNSGAIGHGRLPRAKLSLACVMRAADIEGEAGQSVRELAERLGVRRIRFRPLLPLGRAQDWDEPPTSESLGAHLDPLELIESGFQPVSGCGLGQNLYVEPTGESFPCYAYHRPHALLGNVLRTGLRPVLESASFRDLACHTVDTNEKCRACELRYLCGGACRAWGGEVTQHNLDAAPPECEGLRQRATRLLAAAQQYLCSQVTTRGEEK